MKTGIWLSFDLGVRGDFTGLFAWLDDRKAKECGDGVAFLKFEWTEDLKAELEAELRAHIEVTKQTRIYVVRQKGVDDLRPLGTWIIGSRRSPPWTGFGSMSTQQPDQ